MERISTFNMSADLATVHAALAGGQLPGALAEPMQALVGRVVTAASQRPVAVYLCANDEDATLRDHFAFLLARTLTRQIPSTLLVDCDFLDTGLHGLVPEADALGFLDLLLYGSSLGVITQETPAGVKTIGAGSFPVTKRMPFVLGAFDEAARRLVNHARCVIFVGPLFDDETELHPLIGAADIPILVRALDRASAETIDPIEERIAATWESELTSVRMVSPGASRRPDPTFSHVLGDDDAEEPVAPAAPPPPPVEATPPAKEPPPPPVEEEPSFAELADEATDPGADEPVAPPPPSPPSPPPAPPQRPIPSPPPPRAAAPPPPPPGRETRDALGRRRRRRVHPVAVVVMVVAAVLALWWIDTHHGEETTPLVTEKTPPPAPAETTAVANPGSTTAAPADASAGETVARADSVQSMASEQVVEEPEYVDPADTRGGSGGTVHLSSKDIHVMEDLQKNFPGQYFIHISSFRRSVEARDEVAFLESHEFPVFIVFLDLDAKGKWYRVYAGPFRTRDEAREVKKSLDDIPRVRFTRITKISG